MPLHYGLSITMLDELLEIGPDGLPQAFTVGTAAADYPQAV